jgi:hypothetical protein
MTSRAGRDEEDTTKYRSKLGCGEPKCLCRSFDAEDDSLEIVGQDLKAHFGAHMRECPHQEVRGAHPQLESSEDVLDRPASDPHLTRIAIQPPLHLIEQRFMLPSSDAALRPSRALLVKGAT